jgi:Uncharacterised nucleotidyltransferase
MPQLSCPGPTVRPGMACANHDGRMAVEPESSLSAEERAFYCSTLQVFQREQIEVLVGGAYAFAYYTGIERHTKDLDIFVRARDFENTVQALARAGYTTDIPFPHWLGKAYCGDYFVDIIYSSGNGVAAVDEEWFRNARPGAVFEIPVKLCPLEEMLWSKALIQERERYDGADVAHLLLCRAESIDWKRLLRRFGGNWRVLLSHLVLFGYIYPTERDRVPAWVMHELMRRLSTSLSAPRPSQRVCRGTLLSRQQYLIDTQRWGYLDARLRPDNRMNESDIATWTAAIEEDGSTET